MEAPFDPASASGGRAFNVDPERIAIGGHSLGGGIATAFAVRDSAATPVVSIAGNDLGEFARRLRSDPALAAGLRARMSEMQRQPGFAPGDPAAVVQEILDHEAVFGHTENTPSLARRSILLVGGWDDATAPVETVLLPSAGPSSAGPRRTSRSRCTPTPDAPDPPARVGDSREGESDFLAS